MSKSDIDCLVDTSELVRAREASKMIGISLTSIYGLVKKKTLIPATMGRSLWFTRSNVSSVVEQKHSKKRGTCEICGKSNKSTVGRKVCVMCRNPKRIGFCARCKNRKAQFWAGHTVCNLCTKEQVKERRTRKENVLLEEIKKLMIELAAAKRELRVFETHFIATGERG